MAKLDGSGTSLFILGSDSQLGRDEFLRLLYGARVSLEVAIGATILGMVVGVLMGAIAGYFGGWMDTIVSRITEIVMAFPVLLFIIALASTIGDRLNHVTFGFLQPGVFTLTMVIGVFGWYYPARIIRAVVLIPAREGVRRGRAHARRERRAHHPFASTAPPGRSDHRLLDA